MFTGAELRATALRSTRQRGQAAAAPPSAARVAASRLGEPGAAAAAPARPAGSRARSAGARRDASRRAPTALMQRMLRSGSCWPLCGLEGTRLAQKEREDAPRAAPAHSAPRRARAGGRSRSPAAGTAGRGAGQR